MLKEAGTSAFAGKRVKNGHVCAYSSVAGMLVRTRRKRVVSITTLGETKGLSAFLYSPIKGIPARRF